MVRGPPQKYQNRASCSVSIEMDLKQVALDMGIDFTRALTHGLQFLIDYRLKSGEKVPADTLERYKRAKEIALKDLQEYLKIEQDRQTILSETIEKRKESEARLNEKIEVYDEESERLRVIKRKEYQPGFHEFRRVVK